jgi:anti-anti-sigma regulatory factor
MNRSGLGDTETHDTLTLGPTLDGPAVEDLLATLRDRVLAGQPVVLDGNQVDRVATPGLQVLVAASREARARQLPFSLNAASACLADAIASLGLQAELPIEGYN